MRLMLPLDWRKVSRVLSVFLPKQLFPRNPEKLFAGNKKPKLGKGIIALRLWEELFSLIKRGGFIEMSTLKVLVMLKLFLVGWMFFLQVLSIRKAVGLG